MTKYLRLDPGTKNTSGKTDEIGIKSVVSPTALCQY